jgi:4,5-dihydroxyphthalate decarboxylase
MTRLNLSIAIGNYDRIRPLADGEVQMDGVDPVFMFLSPEEIFFRAFRHAEFDICELSLSSYTLKTAQQDCAYVAVPIFPSRAFRHNAITVRTDRISRPEDMKGRRIGIPEYQLTANVWVRALLADQYGVMPADIDWVRGGLEAPGRVEKVGLTLPADVRIEAAPPTATLSAMLEAGEIDGIIAPRSPSCRGKQGVPVGWLFPDPVKAATEYFNETRIFPIMHVLGLRRSLVDRHPWLPTAVMKAFSRAKTVAMERLLDASASKIMLPFTEERVHEARALMGEDFWSYGLEANRHVLDTFLRHHHRQGLSPCQLAPEELFEPSSLEAFKI